MGPFPSWLPLSPEPAQPVDVFAHLPAGADELQQLVRAVWESDVDHETLERCRARITSLVTGSPTAVPPSAPTASQGAAVEFAEQFVLDPHGCTDAQMHALQDHFTAPQLATLTVAIALFDALARTQAVLAGTEEDPT
jgi:alkylhydroperoxidase family enzyme